MGQISRQTLCYQQVYDRSIPLVSKQFFMIIFGKLLLSLCRKLLRSEQNMSIDRHTDILIDVCDSIKTYCTQRGKVGKKWEKVDIPTRSGRSHLKWVGILLSRLPSILVSPKMLRHVFCTRTLESSVSWCFHRIQQIVGCHPGLGLKPPHRSTEQVQSCSFTQMFHD